MKKSITYAVCLLMLCSCGKVVKKGVETGVKKAGQEIVEKAAKEAAEKAAKEAAEKAAKEAAEEGAEKVLKEGVEEGAEKVLKEGAEKAAKQVYKGVPMNNGKWTGEIGNSIWKPDGKFRPKNRHYSNMNNKSWEQILKENKINGIEFIKGEPNLNPVSKLETKIDYPNLPADVKAQLLAQKPNRQKLHDLAYDQIAKEYKMSRSEVIRMKEALNLVPHETCDGRILLVPREIHDNLTHSGGVSLFRRLFSTVE